MVNKIIVFDFTIEAITSLYFGSERQGVIIRNSKNEPILLGSSIGGALRYYLKKNGVSDDEIIKYMGGVKKDKDTLKDIFIESAIYISDGTIRINGNSNQDIPIKGKEGTMIQPETGTAKDKHKYSLEHLPAGTTVKFTIESEVEFEEQEVGFQHIIETWASGFVKGMLRLGGQQTNGFGEFKLIALEKRELNLLSVQDLEDYIFNGYKNLSVKSIDIGERNSDTPFFHFILKGSFPFGVYQGYQLGDGTTTGIQRMNGKYYLPSTSIKGVFKSELRLLLQRFIRPEKIENKLAEMLGNKERKGILIFSDAMLEENFVRTHRNQRNDKYKQVKETESVYIKIDRLTGGAYEGAIKKQSEIFGHTSIHIYLQNGTKDSLVFPIVYILKKIALGAITLGGRTAIGLGEFEGSEIEVRGQLIERYSVDNNREIVVMSEEQEERMGEYYESFRKWCISE